MGQLIVKSIGSGPNDDYPDLATWWNAQRGNIAASGIISIAELSGEEFITTSTALDMQASQANTSPYSYYIIRAKRSARWKGYINGTEIGSEVARLNIQNAYGIKCAVPYTRFEGFGIKNVTTTINSDRELIGLKINADRVTVDGLMIYSCVLTPDLDGGPASNDLAGAFGIHTFGSGINIINTTIGNVRCVDDGSDGDKNTTALACGVFGQANIINCSVFDIYAGVAAQAGAVSNTANAYGIYAASGTIQNNIVWAVDSNSPDGPELSQCYLFGFNATHSNNVGDDDSNALDSNGIINFTTSQHFKSIVGTYDLTSKTNTPLSSSGVVKSDFLWDFQGQPRIGGWTTGHDQVGSGLANDISYIPLVCFNRIPETITNVWFTDAFERSSLGNTWLGNAWSLENNRLKQNLVAGEFIVASGLYPYNQDVVFTAVASGNTTGQEQGMLLRYVNSDNYLQLSWQPGLDFIDLRGVVDGSQTYFESVILTNDIFTNNVSYNIQAALFDDELGVFINGVEEASFILDSTLNSLKNNSTVGFRSINTDTNRTFYIDNFSINCPMMPLYIKGSGDQIVNNIPLYLNAVSGIYNIIPLHLFSAASEASGSIPLYLFGVSGVPNNNIPLFISAYSSGDNSLPLSILAPMESDKALQLFLQGHNVATSTNNRSKMFSDDFSGNLTNWTVYGSGSWSTNENDQLHINNTNYSSSFIINNTDPTLTNYKVSVDVSTSGTKTNYNAKRAGIMTNFIDNNNYYSLWITYQNIGQDSTVIAFTTKKNGTTSTSYNTRIYEDLMAETNKWGLTTFRDGTVNIYRNDELFTSFVLPTNQRLQSNGLAGLGNFAQTSPYILYDNFEVFPAEFDLFTYGHILNSNTVPLYLEATTVPSNSIPLYVGSILDNSAFIPLYLDSGEFTQSSGFLALNVFGQTIGTSGQFNTVPLTLWGMPTSGVYTSDLELFIGAPSIGTKANTVELSLIGGTFNINNNVPLVLHNHGVGSGLNLFIRGLSLSGADDSAGLPLTAAMPLFIARNENKIIPLYISGHNPYMSGGFNLFAFGASGIINNNRPLYINGTFVGSGIIPLYTHGF